jgi:hypothetical protein
VDAEDGASPPGMPLLVKLVNEMKPARSKLKEAEIIGIFGENTFTLDGEVTAGDDGEINDLKGLGAALSQGTTTGAGGNKKYVIDTGATFISDGVDDTMIVYNTTDNMVADIVNVGSETIIEVDLPIFDGFPKDYYVNENIGGKLAYLQAIT